MHFSAEVSIGHFGTGAEMSNGHWTLRHQRKNLRHFGTKHMRRNVLGPKCLRSEVSVHHIAHYSYAMQQKAVAIGCMQLTFLVFDDLIKQVLICCPT